MLKDILSRGFFAEEMPPCFTGKEFATWATSAQGLLSMGSVPSKYLTRPVRHSHPKAAGHRRQFSVPNPFNYFRLADTISQAWSTEIDPVLATISYGVSRPVPVVFPRAIAPDPSIDRVQRRVESRIGAKYVLKADIQNFYPSIYTHSISWALHTKAFAKANPLAPILGNAIDKYVRQGQSNQTVGIPIGPDTSRVIAEVLLARIEQRLAAMLPGVRVYRFLDDFEFACKATSEIDRALGAIEEALSDFELSTNARKTVVQDLPAATDPTGIAELRAWQFRDAAKSQARDVAAYLDRAAELCSLDPEGSYANYALRRLAAVPLQPSSWKLAEAVAYQFISGEPACIRFAAVLLRRGIQLGQSIDQALFSEAMDSVTRQHLPLHHGSELAWCTWMCIINGVPVPSYLCSNAHEVDDVLTALLLLAAEAQGLCGAQLNESAWVNWVAASELENDKWLFAYEADRQGWLLPASGILGGNGAYTSMKNAGVSFLDLSVKTPALNATGYGLGAGWI